MSRADLPEWITDGPPLDDATRNAIMWAKDRAPSYDRLPTKTWLNKVHTAIETVTGALDDPEAGQILRAEWIALTGPDVPDAVLADLERLTDVVTLLNVMDRTGRPSLPDWMRLATESLVSFYERQTGEHAAPYFKQRSADRPGNDFTRWFCSRMREFDDEITPSNCKTLLETRPSTAPARG